jgi:hypothetical protein
MRGTGQNFIREEIKKRLNSGNACYKSVQRRLSSLLLSENVKIGIYRIIILNMVLYWCVTWALTLKEDYRLKVFENRVLGRIFGPRRGEVPEGWRKLHNEELHGLYSSPVIIRMVKSSRMKLAGCIGTIREKKN